MFLINLSVCHLYSLHVKISIIWSPTPLAGGAGVLEKTAPGHNFRINII